MNNLQALNKDTAKPLVSIVVPVYNVEKYLRRCLNSLVFQTIERIEIILVNDGSPDRSQEIIDEYQEWFPDKIKAYKKPNEGLALTREYGLKRSTASYVCFVDSDDYLHYDSCTLMLEEAVSNDCDIVYAPLYHVSQNSTQLLSKGKLDIECTIENILKYGVLSFCGKLFRKEFLLQYGKFYQMWYEDAAAMPELYSNATRIGYVDKNLYYYMIDRSDSITNVKSDPRTLDTIKANSLALSTVNPTYLHETKVRTAQRFFWYLPTYAFFDSMVEHIKSHKTDVLDESVMEELSNYTRKQLENVLALPEIQIPFRVFLPAFTHSREEARGKYMQEKAFSGDVEVVWLTADTCNTESTPDCVKQAFEEGDLRFVTGYFAVKSIYEQGGVFLDSTVKINCPLNSIVYDSVFFGFLTRNRFTDKILGGAKGSPVLKAILDTYQNDSKLKMGAAPLEQRIKTVLVGMTGIHLNGKEATGLYNTKVYDMFRFVFPIEGKVNLCQLEWGGSINETGEELVHLPTYIIQAVTEQYDALSKQSLNQWNKIKKLNGQIKDRNNTIQYHKRKIRKMRKELAILTNDKGIRKLLLIVLQKIKRRFFH